jgi:TRAP-type C4-dicarboxylate transport system permease small subunit
VTYFVTQLVKETVIDPSFVVAIRSDVAARKSLIFITFIGSAMAKRKGSHIAVEAGLKAMPRRLRHWVLLFIDVLVFGFGLFWAVGIARLPGRELNAFWATYWMLFYSVAGLWLGFGFLAIGLGTCGRKASF